MGRRSLALRPVKAPSTREEEEEEKAPEIIEILDDEQRQDEVEEPSFTLMPMSVPMDCSPADEVGLCAQQELPLDGASDPAPAETITTALAPQAPSSNYTALHDTTAPATPTSAVGAESGSVAMDPSRKVCELYQSTAQATQLLQLAFIRRRAPVSSGTSIRSVQAEFVVPLPSLCLNEFLPEYSASVRDLTTPAASNQAPDAKEQEERYDRIKDSTEDGHQVVFNSAVDHFFHADRIERDIKRRWAVLHDWEWHQVLQHAQATKNDDDVDMDQSAQPLKRQDVPSIQCISSVLQDCDSVSFGEFVWEELMVPVIQRHCAASARDKVTSRVVLDASLVEFLKLLVSTKAFSKMETKEFRRRLARKDLSNSFGGQEWDPMTGFRIETLLFHLFIKARE